MGKMDWDETLSVKVAEIDEQHRRWIEIINELHGALLSKDSGGKLTERILGEMLDYASFHFVFEEDYLRKIGFPELGAHRQLHQSFLNAITEKFQEEKRGELVLNTEVMRLLIDWLRDHIINEDRKYMLFNQSRSH